MNLIRRKPERIEVRGGFYYNQFPTLDLGSGLQVVVHSLAFGDETGKNLKPRFEHRVERLGRKGRQARIAATCIAPNCAAGPQFMLGEDGRGETQPFVPKEGVQLDRHTHLPWVTTHAFGIILGAVAMDTDPAFFEEIAAHTEVGLITK